MDQTLWLARRLGMDARFFATNEGLQGLAVLSNVEIVFDDGTLLTSRGHQTGLQRVQILPDNEVITIYNTWLGLLLQADVGRLLEDQEQDQLRQLNEIFSIIESHHPDGLLGRTVLGGTFNNVPDSPLIEMLEPTSFEDAFAGQPATLSMTVDTIGGIRARFDYLWLANMVRIGGGVMQSRASDHRMAVVEVLITR